jgi:DtxR family transcriptional regulator, Mn-dependent transcriptional regulator
VTFQPPEHHPAFEEYCETIFELAEDGVQVKQARIAERLEVAPPSVSEMIHRMVDVGLVKLAEGQIELTSKGTDLATQVVRRHRLAECFLTDVLGLSWTEAHHEAGKWEHIISGSVEEAMRNILDDPTTCPHGNPIPGSNYRAPEDAVVLSNLADGESFVVERITEELEFADGLLEYFEKAELKPGSEAQIKGITPAGIRKVEINGKNLEIDLFASERILVTSL